VLSSLDGAALELGAGVEVDPLELTGPFIAAVKEVTVVVVVVVVLLTTVRPFELFGTTVFPLLEPSSTV
jgi:hypothetical protein